MTTKRTRMFGARMVAPALLLGLLALATVSPASASTPAPGLTATINVLKIKLTWTASGRVARTIEVQKLGPQGWKTLRTVKNSATKGTVADTAAGTRYIDYRARATVKNGTPSDWTMLHFDTFPALPTTGVVPCPDDYIPRAFVALNAWRAQHGTDPSSRAPIEDNVYLAREATANSIYMARIENQSHALFDSGGPRKYGYPEWGLGLTAENVLFIGTPEQAIVGWDRSPKHHDNMLRPTTHGAFGCMRDTHRGFEWWTLIMGTVVISGG